MTKNKRQPAKSIGMTTAQKRLAREMEQALNSLFFGTSTDLGKPKSLKRPSAARPAKSSAKRKNSPRKEAAENLGETQTSGRGETK